MSAWECGGKPVPGATVSSLNTRSGPNATFAGSW